MTEERLLASVMLFCVPFALISLWLRSGLYMLFPFFGAIPGVAAVLLIFEPLETYLQSRNLGHLQDLLVPAAGALIIVLLTLAMSATPDRMRALRARAGKEGRHFWRGLGLWSLLGGLWGGAWRLSDWGVRYIGTVANG